MAWWSTVHPTKVLFVVVADEPYTRIEGIYRDAVRLISLGNYETFRFADRTMQVFMCSRERVLPHSPMPAWAAGGIPRNLPERLASSVGPSFQRVATVDLGGRAISIQVPEFFQQKGRLLAPSPLSLEPEWDSLFPGNAHAEGILLKRDLTQLFSQRLGDPESFRHTIETRTRERVVALACPNQLPYWDLLAAEDPEQARAEAKHTLKLIGAAAWPEFRQSPEFLIATRTPMPVAVALGWQGVMWLQLAAALRPDHCKFEDCLEPVATGLVRYCGGEHQELAKRQQGRRRTTASRHNRPRGPATS